MAASVNDAVRQEILAWPDFVRLHPSSLAAHVLGAPSLKRFGGFVLVPLRAWVAYGSPIGHWEVGSYRDTFLASKRRVVIRRADFFEVRWE